MTQAEYTAQDIAAALGISARAVRMKAKAEKWPHRDVAIAGNGGKRRVYPTETLPAAIKLAIYNREQDRDQEAGQLAGAFYPAPRTQDKLAILGVNNARYEGVSPERRGLAYMKAMLVEMYENSIRRAPRGQKVEARSEFLRAYHGGAWPDLLEKIGPLGQAGHGWKTLERWKLTVKKEQDTIVLADRRGISRRGHTEVTTEQADILVKAVLHPNAPLVSEALRTARSVMKARGVEDTLSDATYRRFLEAWRSRNYDQWVFIREGQTAWNDRVCPYVERDYSLISVGEIMVGDGHTLNFEIINPWTGHPGRMTLLLWYDMRSSMPLGWEIMPTENILTIASALRRAVIRLGKIPAIAYIDNGRAFKSKFFGKTSESELIQLQGLFARLGIRDQTAWAYHGQSKTVERFFQSFAELERLIPSYTGTSIDTKPPRMKRGEKLHRAVYEATGSRPLTIFEAHHVIAQWFDAYASRPQQSGHLEGVSPQEVFEAGRGPGVDPEILRECLLATKKRTIGRNGVNLFGRSYYHPALYARVYESETSQVRRKDGQKDGNCYVRYDIQDTSRVWVYDLEWNLICVADEKAKQHPAARILGTDDHRKQLTDELSAKKRLEKLAGATARDQLRHVYVPEVQAQMAEIEAANQRQALPQAAIAAETEDVAAGLAQLEEMNRDSPDINPEILRYQASGFFMPTVADEWQQVREMSEWDRYEHLVELEMADHIIPRDFLNFMRYFEKTEVYKRSEDHFETLRMRCGMRQCQAAKG